MMGDLSNDLVLPGEVRSGKEQRGTAQGGSGGARLSPSSWPIAHCRDSRPIWHFVSHRQGASSRAPRLPSRLTQC